MGNALIGHTGFVGGNLLGRMEFQATYNSKNIGEIEGKSFDTVVCAGVSATKWLANQKPLEDLQGIAPLLTALQKVRAGRFVLISTVDVYTDPRGVDETTPIRTEDLHPYGTHRRLIELFALERFPRCLIVRLPGLFGQGLKKNIIYDLLNRNRLEYIHPKSHFQFYDLRWLPGHLQKLLEGKETLVNLATPPITTADVARVGFGIELPPCRPEVTAAAYDMRTVHAGLFGRSGPYLCDAKEELEAIREFVEGTRGK